MPQIMEIVQVFSRARLGDAGAFLAVADVPLGPCAQAQGPGLSRR